MAWSQDEINKLKALAGVYRLPKGCWAVLTVKDQPVPKEELLMYPEGVEYAWVILMPGNPPKLRGERMAGVDNADDAHVRKAIESEPLGPLHRAHRHEPNWRKVVKVCGEEWPRAGKGEQLAKCPANTMELWLEIRNCLDNLFEDLGVDPPTDAELAKQWMSEDMFQEHQMEVKQNTKLPVSKPT